MLIIYVVRLISYLGLSSILPFFSVWLTGTHLFNVTSIALLVSLLILSNRLTSYFFSPIIARFHKKHVVIFSLCVAFFCSIGMYFAAQAQFEFIYFWFLMTLIFGMMFSIINLCFLALISKNIEEKKQMTGFSYLNVAANISAGIGPFIGGMVMHYFPTLTPLIPAFFLAISFAISLMIPLDKELQIQSISFKQIFHFTDFRTNILLSINFLMFIAYAQFYETFPLLAKHFITPGLIGSLFLISGITIALLQIPITRLSNRLPFNLLVVSHLLFLVGLVLLTFVIQNSYAPLIAGVILISISEIIYGPLYQTLCIKWHKPIRSEIALGKLNLTWGGGNTLGAYIGLYWIGHQHFYYPYVLGVGALALATVLLLFNKRAF